MPVQQKITPCLWVEKDAKAVADYYLFVFKDGKLKDYQRFKKNRLSLEDKNLTQQ